MIITVTLNAAIDKTLAVPNFRLGRRHRAVEQTAMAGGKGVNVARALKALGQPVIATGVAGGPTGTRIIEQLTEEAILNDFVRIREESRTSTAVVDPTTGEQTEINEHGPHVSEAELELFVGQAALPGQGRRRLRVLRQPAARRRRRPLRAADRGGEAARRDDRPRLGGRAADARHARRAPTSSARTSSRPRSWWATSSRTRRTAARAIGEMVELGAREAIMTLPDGCLAAARRRRASARLYRATLEPLEPVSSVGSGDAFLAGFVAARYAGPQVEDCLRFAVACGAESTQHFGAGVLDPREVERLVPEVQVEQLGDARTCRARASVWHAARSASSAAEPRILHGSRDRPRQEGPSRIRLR